MAEVLIRIDAQDGAGAAAPLLLASHDTAELCHLGDSQWFPALLGLPRLRYDFFGGTFAGQVTAPGTAFSCAIDGIAGFSTRRYADARVRIWAGDLASTTVAEWRTLVLDFLNDTYSIDRAVGGSDSVGPLPLRFDGLLTGEPEIDDAQRVARFSASVDDAWMDDPLLALFGGTGGIEGPDELTGTPKPWALGNLRFAAGVLVDPVDNVWMVSDGAIEGVNAAYDRGATLGTSAGDSASFAALEAATIAAGGWRSAKAAGLVRTGAPMDGQPSFDVSGDNTGGWARLPGAMIARIAARGGYAASTSAMAAALDAARPWNLALQMIDQITAREAIAQLADSVAAVAGVSWTGALYAQPVGFGTPVATLNADDSSDLAVLAVEELAKASPLWRLATFAEPTWVVHDQAELATGGYTPRGEWNTLRVYRQDDLVTSPTDGRPFVYTSATPGAGHALPAAGSTSNAQWTLFGAADNTASNLPRHEPANTSKAFTANYQGQLDGGQLPKTVQIKRYRGTVDVSNSSTWSILTQGAISGGTVTVSNGVVNIPTGCVIPLATEIRVQSVRDGFTIISTIAITRADAQAPTSGGSSGGGTGGTVANLPLTGSTNSTTSVALTSIVPVETGTAAQIDFAGLLAIYADAASPAGSFGATLRWRLGTSEGSLSEIGSDIPSGAAATVLYDEGTMTYEGIAGSVNVALTYTSGLSANTTYYVQLWGKRASGSPSKTLEFGGAASATGS